MKNLSLVFSIMASALFIQSCAHSAIDKKIDSKVAQETSMKTRVDLGAEAYQLIQTAPGLDADQRSRLLVLRDSSRAKDNEMREQSLKLRSVLIKELVTANYDDAEIEAIKKRIRDIENDRLALTFNSVKQANSILGHETVENRKYMMSEFF